MANCSSSLMLDGVLGTYCSHQCNSDFGTTTYSCTNSQSITPSASGLSTGNYCWCYH